MHIFQTHLPRGDDVASRRPTGVKSRTGSEESGATQSGGRWRWLGLLNSSARQCFNWQLLHRRKHHNTNIKRVDALSSEKKKVTADLLYIHLYIIKHCISFRCRHIQSAWNHTHLHSLCSLYGILKFDVYSWQCLLTATCGEAYLHLQEVDSGTTQNKDPVALSSTNSCSSDPYQTQRVFFFFSSLLSSAVLPAKSH